MLFCMKLHKYSMVFYFLVLFICHHPCRSQSCWTWNPNPSGPHPTASSRRSGDSDGCGSNHRKRDRASYQFHDHSQPSNKINMLNNLATTTPSMTCRISDMRICWTKRTRHASFQWMKSILGQWCHLNFILRYCWRCTRASFWGIVACLRCSQYSFWFHFHFNS